MKKRQSNFELLRIIAMFCIVLGHSMTHGVLINSSVGLSATNFLIFRFLAYSGKIGVYLFILITGYFMIYSTISIKKIAKLWLSVVFWSVSLTIIVGYIINQLSYKDVAISFLPIISNRYWFVSTYVFLYLLVPFINSSILALNKKQELLVILLGILVIVPSNYFYGSNINSWLMIFCFTYAIGGILRKRNFLKSVNNRGIGLGLLVFGLCMNLLNSIIVTYANYSLSFLNEISVFFEKETLFCLFIALGLFILLGSRNISHNNMLNAIAATTFGIYLIHDNSKMEYLLWIKIFHMNQLHYSNSIIETIVYILICVLTTFAVCSVLEILRIKCLRNLESKIATCIDDKTKKIFDKRQ